MMLGQSAHKVGLAASTKDCKNVGTKFHIGYFLWSFQTWLSDWMWPEILKQYQYDLQLWKTCDISMKY